MESQSFAKALRKMKICRFCLDEEGPLTNIYEKQTLRDKQTVPLPLQLMACVAIEVFENDGMPQMICKTCREQTYLAYTFKSTCKKSEDALKMYLVTGSLSRTFSDKDMAEHRKVFHETKRLVEEADNARAKRPKWNDEVITLNFTSPIGESTGVEDFEEQVQTSLDDDKDDEEDEEEEDDDDEEYLNLDENEKDLVVNPTLKVNQVKTDCFPCPHCERSFPLKQLLDLHKANHNRERNFQCEDCDKAFFTKYDLSKHSLTHVGTKPFCCVVCHKAFARESLLHRHEKIHIDVPKYLCAQCDRTFLTSEDFDAHSAKHKKKRPFSCQICQKSFVFKQGLERHEQTHNNVRPHRCNYCEATFTSAIKLTRHVTSHAGLRPYPCKLCGRTFLLSHHLTRHMRSHYAAQQSDVSQIGQHKCDVCSMSFRRKVSLINHSAIHSMVNLKCVICNKEFDNVAKVKEHIATHLADLPYPCEKCDYSFETQEQLEEHEVKHAEMEYEDQIEQEVIAEARQAATEGDEDNSEFSGDEIAEYTITNDMNNPEVVRRSKRTSKIENYAEFLKSELGSDLEEGDDGEVEAADPQDEYLEEETIKPIVRTEGTKVYTRKLTGERSKFPAQAGDLAAVVKPAQATTVDNIKEINKYQDKEIFNMKIGDKTVVVQKLVLTKDQMKAMAKEGKLEKKGNTFLLKKNAGQTLENLNLDSFFAGPSGKTPKKTYNRKVESFEDEEEEEGTFEELPHDESFTQ